MSGLLISIKGPKMFLLKCVLECFGEPWLLITLLFRIEAVRENSDNTPHVEWLFSSFFSVGLTGRELGELKDAYNEDWIRLINALLRLFIIWLPYFLIDALFFCIGRAHNYFFSCYSFSLWIYSISIHFLSSSRSLATNLNMSSSPSSCFYFSNSSCYFSSYLRAYCFIANFFLAILFFIDSSLPN